MYLHLKQTEDITKFKKKIIEWNINAMPLNEYYTKSLSCIEAPGTSL